MCPMADADGGHLSNERLARVISHPLRQRLIWEYTASVTSPSRVAAALGERVNLVSYHTHVLLRAGCIELVRTVPRRGATEHFYRALVTGEILDADWGRLPTALQRALVRLTIDVSWREVGDALPRGGMDDTAAHVSRTFLTLDPQGREELAALLRSTTEAAGEIEQASRERSGPGRERWELLVFGFRRAACP
jgi:hypothetical protein